MHFKFKQFKKASSQKQLIAQQESMALNDALKEAADAIEIETQALDELDTSTASWETRFKDWRSGWREGLESLSFDRVKQGAFEVLEDVDPEIMSLVAPVPANGDPETKAGVRSSVDSKHAEYAKMYQHYASSVSSMDLTRSTPRGIHRSTDERDSCEVSIVGDDIDYADLARAIPDSQHSKSSVKLHVYHNLRF